MTEKLCRKCGTVKTAAMFHKRNSRPCGLFPWCKDCMKAYQKSNRPATAAAVTRYRTKNAQSHRAYNADYKAKNRTAYTALENARRSKATGSGGGYTIREWSALKVACGNACLRCGIAENLARLTADHIIPISCGGTSNIVNIQPLCKKCNSAKHTDTTDYRSNDMKESYFKCAVNNLKAAERSLVDGLML